MLLSNSGYFVVVLSNSGSAPALLVLSGTEVPPTTADETVLEMLRLFQVFGEDGQLRHFVDGRGTSSCWMSYVNCARCCERQL